MKSNLVIALLFTLCAAPSFAESEERVHVISGEPAKAVFGSLAAAYQFKLDRHWAVTVPVFFGTDIMVPVVTKTLNVVTGRKHESFFLAGGGGLGARYFINGDGMTDGAFVEPRVTIGYSKFTLRDENVLMVDSQRLTISPTALAGYSWFFDNGFYVSTAAAVGFGFHAKNSVAVDNALAARLKDESYMRNRLWANESRWRFEYDVDISLGYSF